MAALRPPFKANDMAGLYKKVVTAQYPPISSRYSQEFREMITLMLQSNPNLRPTTDQMLNLPVMREKIQQLRAFDPNVEACISPIGFLNEGSQNTTSNDYLNFSSQGAERGPSQSGALLNTIKLPRILRQLAERLPKPNYESSLTLKQHTIHGAGSDSHRDSTTNAAHIHAIKAKTNQKTP